MKVSKESQAPPLRFDPSLAEESVLLRLAGDPLEKRFRRIRDRIYEVPDEEEREKQFRRLHREWFERLELDAAVRTALEEQPLLCRSIRCCHVGGVARARDEGADLYGPPPHVAGLRLTPPSLLQPRHLITFLRHEFQHLADIVDPAFGFERELPRSELGPAHDNLVRDRYRVLCDTWIDGRMLRRGWLGDEVRAHRKREFARAFSVLGEHLDAAFHHWFDRDFHRHQEMLALARDPGSGPQPRGHGCCPVCKLPCVDLPGGEDLDAATIERVGTENPDWDPAQGLCAQCAELYRSRHLALRDLAELPGAADPGLSG